jgi:hypothetical protein
MHEKSGSTALFILNIELYVDKQSTSPTLPFAVGEQTPLFVKNKLDGF